MANTPHILITTGDPRGIGPEVVKKALEFAYIKKIAEYSIIRPSDETGFDAIEKAVKILNNGGADGLVTAPVNKSAITKSGIPFKGHTEYLARTTHSKNTVMMFCAKELKVALVTRHLALKKVPRFLTRGKIKSTILLTGLALKKYFSIKKPRIGICGLNPHAGENGLLGLEEETIVAPAIKSIKSRDFVLEGPLPADVVFYMLRKKRFDAAVSMYHDRGRSGRPGPVGVSW